MYTIGRGVNCGVCSYTGCDDGGDEVQVSVIRIQVNWIIVIDGGESLADPWHIHLSFKLFNLVIAGILKCLHTI